MVTCSICFEQGRTELGQLDSCDHKYCFPCISKWAEQESRCPLCKARFRTITHRRCDKDDGDEAATKGEVLAVLHIPERNQRPEVEDAEHDPMDTLVCMECGGGDDEEFLLICDRCDNGCHTWCARLEGIPEGEWVCRQCVEDADGDDVQPAGAPSLAARPRTRSRQRGRQGPSRSRSRELSTEPLHARLERRQSGRAAAARQGAPAGGSTARRRRRLVRGNGGPIEVGSVADFLDVLEARANRASAGDLPTAAHRRVEEMRRSIDAVRQGRAETVPLAGSSGAAAASPAAAAAAADRDSAGQRQPGRPGSDDDIIASWAAWEETRRGSRKRHVEEDEEDDMSGAAIRRRLAQAAEEGRRLGPTGRLRKPASQQRPAQARSVARSPPHNGLPRRDSSPRRRDASPRRHQPQQQTPLQGTSRHAPAPAAVQQAASEQSGHSRGYAVPLPAQRLHPPQQPAQQLQQQSLQRQQQPLPMRPVPATMHAPPGVGQAGNNMPAHTAAAAAAAMAPPAKALREVRQGPGSSDDSSTSSLAPHLTPDAAAWRRREEAAGQPSLWPHQAVQQQQQQQEPARAQRRAEVFASKADAAARVKDLLRPLLRQGLVDRDVFREAARRATHTVYSGDARSARDALGEALAELDAQQAAVAVLRAA